MSEALLRDILNGLRQYWSDRTAVLLLDDDGRVGRSLITEIKTCGGQVGGVVARQSLALPLDLPPGRVWCCAEQGLRLSSAEFEDWLGYPSESTRAWLDGLDPMAGWTAVGTPGVSAAEFCGRPVHGFRRAEWAALEDKTVIDTFWERAGIRSPAYRVMDVAMLGTQTSHTEISAWSDLPSGVVIAADSSAGHLDRCMGLRWVRGSAQCAEGLAALTAISRKVRVAEFVRGVPCSILGMVTLDGVAVFPPLEIVTLGSAAGDLRFCGSSTYWRPGPAAVAELVHACRAAGEELARTVSYLGIFSIDGVLGEDGFLATELNSRHASGLGTRAGLPELPVYLFNRAVQEQLAGFSEMPGVEVEMLISSAVASAPSLSLTVPASARTTTGQLVVHTSFGPVECEVVGTQARITRPPMLPPDRRMGPVCAEVSRSLDHPAWFCFPEGVSA